MTIICQFAHDGGQWIAHFDGAPVFAFGGDMPVKAIRRLLEGKSVAPARFVLLCDRDRVGSGVLQYTIVWEPPELLFPCQACEGRGEYIGLLEREVCHACGGRKLIPV